MTSTCPTRLRSPSCSACPLERARTLPGRWYADADHHELELDRDLRRRLGRRRLADDVAAPGSYLAADRRRRSPCSSCATTTARCGRSSTSAGTAARRSAEGCGAARALSCPYHAWVYRLDGSLARAGGVGRPDGFDPADSGLRADQVTTFARSVLVNVDPAAPPFDPGPLGAGLEPYRLDELELGGRTRYERAFNWKVLLENYCENYHTPFVHSQLPTAGYEYPIECAGPDGHRLGPPARAARTRPNARSTTTAPASPGGPASPTSPPTSRSTTATYLAVFPNTGCLVLRRVRGDVPAACRPARRRRSSSGSTSGTRRSRPSGGPPTSRRPAEVVEQDLEMCEALQRTYDAGCSADGVLSTEHESGVGPRAPARARERSTGRADSVASRSCRRGRVDPHPHRRRARRQQILDATHRVTLERGLHDVRISDVADELGVSTGLIHYHFATKDELIEAMLRDAGRRRRAAGRGRRWPSADARRSGSTAGRREYLPSRAATRRGCCGSTCGARRCATPTCARISEELDEAWVSCSPRSIADGVDAGVAPLRRPAGVGVAARAMLDGLGLQVVLHHGTMTRAQMRKPRPPRRRARARLRPPRVTDLRESNSARQIDGRTRIGTGGGGGSIPATSPSKPVARRRPLVRPLRVGNGDCPRQPRCTPHESLPWCSLSREPPRTSERRCASRWTTPVPRRSPSSTRSRPS